MEQEMFEKIIQAYIQQIGNMNHQIMILILENERLKQELAKGDE